MCGNPGQDLPIVEQPCLFRGKGECRDVVQRRPYRQSHVFKGAGLSVFVQFVQRNRLLQSERPGLGAPEHGDMADRAQRMRYVAGKAADIGAF